MSAGQDAGALFAFVVGRIPVTSRFADDKNWGHGPPPAPRTCLLCFLAFDTVSHLLECRGVGRWAPPEPTVAPASPAGAPVTNNAAPALPAVVAAEVHVAQDFIAFGPKDAVRFMRTSSLADTVTELAPLLRSLCPRSAAHLRFSAPAVAKLASDLLRLREEHVCRVLDSGRISVNVGVSGDPAGELPPRIPAAPAPSGPDLATAPAFDDWLWSTRQLRLYHLGPFGSVLAAIRVAEGLPLLPLPSHADTTAFREVVIKLAKESEVFRVTLGRGVSALRERFRSAPVQALSPLDQGTELVAEWSHAQPRFGVNQDTFAALVYTLAASRVPATPRGLIDRLDYVSLGGIVPLVHRCDTAGFFLGSFAYERSSDSVFFVAPGDLAPVVPAGVGTPSRSARVHASLLL